MPIHNQPRRPRLVTLTFALTAIGAVVTVASSAFAANSSTTPKHIIIANSGAADPAARQIVRAVADESLKTISTKDSALHEDSIVERLEDPGPIVLPAKVVTEAAPGTGSVEKVADKSVKTEAVEATAVEENEARTPAAAPEKAAPEKKAEEKPQAKKDDSVPADKALSWLQNGNKRYVKKSHRADGKSQADRDRLAKSQRPHAIVLSCSDSHAPPETVFDQSLGEIYVVRTAGESLDSAVIASLEHAVETLGPRLLVVMGHTGCSAVSAAVHAHEHTSTGSPSLDLMIADIQPRLPARGPAGAASKDLEIESSANAQGVAADLLKRSPLIKARVDKGELTLKPALYYNDTGLVKFY